MLELLKAPAAAFNRVSSVAQNIVHFFSVHTAVIGYSAILFFIATSSNLQVVAAFTENNGPWVRIAATALVAITATTLFVIREREKSQTSLLFDLALFALPSLIIAFLPPWDDGGWAAVVVVWLAQAAVMFTYRGYHPERVHKLGAVIFGLFVILYVAFTIAPIELARGAGAVVLAVTFLSLLIPGIACVWRSPNWRYVIGLFVLIGFLFFEFQHDADYHELEPFDGAAYANADPFALWLFDRADANYYRDNNLPYPVFLVSSEGGGGFAMAHSFSFLDQMTERCANFPQHLFALVGVSGGQVGNTLYHANLQPQQPETVTPCKSATQASHAEYLSVDHLSPLLGHLLFVEIPRKLLLMGESPVGRTDVLLQSFNSVPEDYAPIPDIPYWKHFWDFSSPENFFAYRLNEKPALVSVTTNVQTGNRFVFAPFDFITRAETYYDLFAYAGDLDDVQQRLTDPALGHVSLASASFPWVTPSLRFAYERGFSVYLDNDPQTDGDDWKETGPVQRGEFNLVDGGYFENSGAETLSEIVATLSFQDNPIQLQRRPEGSDDQWYQVDNDYPHRSFDDVDDCPALVGRPVDVMQEAVQWAECEVPYFLVSVLVRNAAIAPQSGGQQSFLADPVKTLLQSRTARGELAISMLEERRCGFTETSSCFLRPDHFQNPDPNTQIYTGVFQSLVDMSAMNLPLGWSMPLDRMQEIERYVVPDDDICAQFDDGYGGIDWRIPPTDRSLHDPELDRLAKTNCSNLQQMVRYFDAGALFEALSFDN